MKKYILILFIFSFGVSYAQLQFRPQQTNALNHFSSGKKDTTKIYDYTQGRRVWYVFPSFAGLIPFGANASQQYRIIGLSLYSGYGYFVHDRWVISLNGWYSYYFVRPISDYREFNIGLSTRYFFLKAAPRLYFYTGARLGLEFFTHRAEEGFTFYHDMPNGEWHTHFLKVFTPEIGISVPFARRYAFNFGFTYHLELFRKSGRQPNAVRNDIGLTINYYIFMRKKKNKIF